jgi:acetyl-CoA carboxylase biotin carboxylase subunit
MDIPFYYDPMIAKLITHAENRQEAITKMIRAIDEYEITGLETTLGFCRFVMEHDAFTSGKFDTRFVENYFKPEVLQTKALGDEERIASVLAVMFANGNKKKDAESVSGQQSVSKWKRNRLV